MKYQLALALLLLIPHIAVGDEPNCNIPCPTGEVMKSFTAGNSISCQCGAPSQMIETVPNTDLVSDDNESVAGNGNGNGNGNGYGHDDDDDDSQNDEEGDDD